jgi:uncharacterized protein (DUF433 family)
MTQLENYFNFLAPNDIRLKGTRIGIETILYDYIYHAKTSEEIAKTYSSLTLEQVYATILYYLHDQEKITHYLTEWIEHGERMRAMQKQNPPAVAEKLRALREQRKSVKPAHEPEISLR